MIFQISDLFFFWCIICIHAPARHVRRFQETRQLHPPWRTNLALEFSRPKKKNTLWDVAAFFKGPAMSSELRSVNTKYSGNLMLSFGAGRVGTLCQTEVWRVFDGFRRFNEVLDQVAATALLNSLTGGRWSVTSSGMDGGRHVNAVSHSVMSTRRWWQRDLRSPSAGLCCVVKSVSNSPLRQGRWRKFLFKWTSWRRDAGWTYGKYCCFHWRSSNII